MHICIHKYVHTYLDTRIFIIYIHAQVPNPTLHDPGVAGLKRRLMPSPRALSFSRSGNTELEGAIRSSGCGV